MQAWAAVGSTPDSRMCMQRFADVPYVCDVALMQAGEALCDVSCWPFVAGLRQLNFVLTLLQLFPPAPLEGEGLLPFVGMSNQFEK